MPAVRKSSPFSCLSSKCIELPPESPLAPRAPRRRPRAPRPSNSHRRHRRLTYQSLHSRLHRTWFRNLVQGENLVDGRHKTRSHGFVPILQSRNRDSRTGRRDQETAHVFHLLSVRPSRDAANFFAEPGLLEFIADLSPMGNVFRN